MHPVYSTTKRVSDNIYQTNNNLSSRNLAVENLELPKGILSGVDGLPSRLRAKTIKVLHIE